MRTRDPQAHARLRRRSSLLFVVALGVGGYILSNQRFYLPEWVPVVGSDFVDYKAEFSTAQSVTPGQGQTVEDRRRRRSARSPRSTSKDGRAVVTMKIRRKYTPIYKDATALLRPKTGLNDMIIELDPGLEDARARRPTGCTIPVNQTLPNVNLDEILAGARRRHARLPAAARRRRRRGPRRQRRATCRRRSGASSRPAATSPRSPSALAERRDNIRRSIHNFRLLAEALGDKDDELAALVDSSNARLPGVRRPGRAPARGAAAAAAARCDATNTALAKADRLGHVARADARRPAARRPRARARRCAQTRPFLRRRRRSSENQLRPFARDALPTVQGPAARGARPRGGRRPKLTTSLERRSTSCSTSSPTTRRASEEGYLFWAAWANHAGATRLRHAGRPRPDPPRPRRWPRARRWPLLQQLSGPVNRSSARSATLLNPPDRRGLPAGQAGADARRTPRRRAARRPPRSQRRSR